MIPPVTIDIEKPVGTPSVGGDEPIADVLVPTEVTDLRGATAITMRWGAETSDSSATGKTSRCPTIVGRDGA